VSINLSHFGLGIQTTSVGPTARSFRPPSWPPPKDWVCIEDKDGNPVSRYGDPVWDFTPWAGKTTTFDFGDGPKVHARSPVIDPANAEILRQFVAWRAWGSRAAPAFKTLFGFAKWCRQIIQVCSDNKILASDLWRYPAVIDQLAQMLAPSTYDKVVAEMERLRDVRDFLGFELLDAAGIQRLKAAQPCHDTEQTEYIPPRIWGYVVTRVAECISDYCTHQSEIEACFEYCFSAYEQNRVVEYRGGKTTSRRNPFRAPPHGKTGKRCGIDYHGAFANTAEFFGIKNVLERWVGTIDDTSSISRLSTFFQIVQNAARIDIAAFTLMRIKEVTSVRWNGLLWHDDPVYGRIPLIQSETTKTDPDDSGLWVTSPSVESSIRTLRSITKMRLSSAGRWAQEANPYLTTAALEPWGGGRKSGKKVGVKPSIPDLGEFIQKNNLLFDPQELRITGDDLKIAKAVCPTLNTKKFRVGKPWCFAWHQFRRTGAVNMFASGNISDSSIQLQMKHMTRLQPLYYGRGNSALHLNDSARVLLVNAQYEAMGRQLSEVHTNRFISPYGNGHKAKLLTTSNDGETVNLISKTDAQRYEKAARKRLINFRQTALGGCMKNSPCDGDCVSSVSDCAGGNGKSPCINVLFDRTHAASNQTRLEAVVKQLEGVAPDTPMYRFLEQEKRGLENYFAYIRKAV
jgi:hypothetical protein